MGNETLIIKKRGEDGNKVISVRIKEDILSDLDKVSAKATIQGMSWSILYLDMELIT